MNQLSKRAYFCLLLSMLGILGCGDSVSDSPPAKKHEPRPVAGDTVTPLLLPGKAWKQNGPVLLSTRLQVQSEKEAEPRLLQLEDVPYKTVPLVTLTFYREKEELLQMNDVPLTRDC